MISPEAQRPRGRTAYKEKSNAPSGAGRRGVGPKGSSSNSNGGATAWSHKGGSRAGGPDLGTANHLSSGESNQCQGQRLAVVNYNYLENGRRRSGAGAIGRHWDERGKSLSETDQSHRSQYGRVPFVRFAYPCPCDLHGQGHATELGEHRDKSDIFVYGTNRMLACPAWRSWIGGLAAEDPWLPLFIGPVDIGSTTVAGSSGSSHLVVFSIYGHCILALPSSQLP